MVVGGGDEWGVWKSSTLTKTGKVLLHKEYSSNLFVIQLLIWIVLHHRKEKKHNNQSNSILHDNSILPGFLESLEFPFRHLTKRYSYIPIVI